MLSVADFKNSSRAAKPRLPREGSYARFVYDEFAERGVFRIGSNSGTKEYRKFRGTKASLELYYGMHVAPAGGGVYRLLEL